LWALKAKTISPKAPAPIIIPLRIVGGKFKVIDQLGAIRLDGGSILTALMFDEIAIERELTDAGANNSRSPLPG